MNYWLIKSEPTTYSWAQFEQDKKAVWDGVRNYAARINLRAMQKGDLALFYHSNIGLEIVGIAQITKEAYQDPSTEDDRWVAVNVKPYQALNKAVTLAQMKEDDALQNLQLIKISRLSVCAVSAEEFDRILLMAATKLK